MVVRTYEGFGTADTVSVVPVPIPNEAVGERVMEYLIDVAQRDRFVLGIESEILLN
jgi:hypothetical protein